MPPKKNRKTGRRRCGGPGRARRPPSQLLLPWFLSAANSSDSEDQAAPEGAAKSAVPKNSLADGKTAASPKCHGRSPPSSHKYHKQGDADQSQHRDHARSPRVYKWSFQMCTSRTPSCHEQRFGVCAQLQVLKCCVVFVSAELEKMSSLERISFLQEKLQDIRNHYLSLKSEVASIDRRRKRMKKKERESEWSDSSRL